MQAGFLDVMVRHYAAGLNRVDFRRGVDGARAAINRWVENRTTGKIRELIPADGLHRFLFAIREEKNGVILFLGRLADPAQDL